MDVEPSSGPPLRFLSGAPVDTNTLGPYIDLHSFCGVETCPNYQPTLDNDLHYRHSCPQRRGQIILYGFLNISKSPQREIYINTPNFSNCSHCYDDETTFPASGSSVTAMAGECAGLCMKQVAVCVLMLHGPKKLCATNSLHR